MQLPSYNTEYSIYYASFCIYDELQLCVSHMCVLCVGCVWCVVCGINVNP